ncbi:MAG: OmpH family outer membrane protein [Candidatus Gastranaerophilaceae bacterium]
MKKLKLLVITLAIILSSGNNVFAEGIGFIDYQKVVESTPFARDAMKNLDSKALELQQYLVDKEKEYKAIDTPIQKKNFQDKVANDFKAKETAYLKLKAKSENEVYTKIKNAANEVMVQQKLNAIISDRAVFVGGMDVTNLVIEKLKGIK